MLLIIHLAIAGSFLPLAALFRRGKCLWLIAGYNTMSPAEKARIDEKALGRFTAKLMLFCAGCFGVLAVSDVLDSVWLMALGIWALIIGAFAAVVWINLGNRFQRKE